MGLFGTGDAKAWWQNERKAGLLGGYSTEIEAAKSYDKAAIKLWGRKANLNFDYKTYAKDIENMKSYDFASYIAALRRESADLLEASRNIKRDKTC